MEVMRLSVEMAKLNEIAVKVSGMESTQKAQAEAIGKMASSVDRLVDKLDKSDDVAREAMHRVKSAQHQIDGMRTAQRWAIGIVVPSAIAIIGLAIKVIGG